MIDYNTGEFPYNNQENYTRRVRPEQRFEFNEEESMTVPNDSLSIAEILQRSASGIIPEQFDAPYFDQANLDLVNSPAHDLTELAAQREALQSMIDSVDTEIEEIEEEQEDPIDPVEPIDPV